MPSPTSVTAVFDIGKTNKKFLLFDEEYSTVYNRNISLDEIIDDDGYPCENIERIEEWMKEEFREADQNPEYTIKALNISACGASLVHLDKKGKVIAPLYNYLKPYPEELLRQFYNKYGEREKFALETASPPMGMLNSGLQLYWLKHTKPELFSKIRHSLHFPQYLSSLFSGRHASECTSIGCHTAMWNYKSNSYHRWLKEEGVLELLPDIQAVSSLQQNGHVKTGLGIHDSSSALVPYLLALKKPFIQLSTGTWSIVMNPFSTDPLTYEELNRDCLQFMNIYGEPVKASRFFLGSEYSYQSEKLARYFNFEQKVNLQPDPLLLQKLVKQNQPDRKLQLEKAHNTGPYPANKAGNWDVTQFRSFEEAYHQLMLDLVSIQADSLKLAEGSGEVDQIIITGGFARNNFFARLLASFFPDKKIYTAVTPHASALGAALVMEQQPVDRVVAKNLLGLQRHMPLEGEEKIQNYSWA